MEEVVNRDIAKDCTVKENEDVIFVGKYQVTSVWSEGNYTLRQVLRDYIDLQIRALDDCDV
ncbi:MAG: hypothetical protein ACI4D4_07170 [Lachnospira sp.]